MEKRKLVKTPQWVVEKDDSSLKTINRTKTIENIKNEILQPLLNARKDLDNLLFKINQSNKDAQIKNLGKITEQIMSLKSAAEEAKETLKNKKSELESVEKTFTQYNGKSAYIVEAHFKSVKEYMEGAISSLAFKISDYNHYLSLREIYDVTLPTKLHKDTTDFKEEIEEIEKKYDKTFLSIAKWLVENLPSAKPLLASYLSEYNKISGLQKKAGENIDDLTKRIKTARDEAFKEGKKQLEGLKKDEETRFNPTQFFND